MTWAVEDSPGSKMKKNQDSKKLNNDSADEKEAEKNSTDSAGKGGSRKRGSGIRGMLVAALVVAAIAAAGCAFVRKSMSPVEPDKDAAVSEYVKIPSGMSVRAIAEMLEERKLIRSARVFYMAVRFPGILLRDYDGSIVFKSGVYEVSQSMEMLEVIRIFADGKQAFIKTSIPEGLTTKKIARILAENKVCKYEDFIAATSDRAVLEKFGINAANCEGYLFPDTYYFYPEMDAPEVVSMMVENFFTNLRMLDGQGDADGIDYTKLILASIVEREYRVDEEAPVIASVFINRMETGMGLESCATIEYIITEIQGKPHPDIITYKDLKIDSPYNTYKWSSLPPGPISNPGKVALSAVLNPAQTDFYYFTLTDSERGAHTFSRTLKAHARATAEFRTKRFN